MKNKKKINGMRFLVCQKMHLSIVIECFVYYAYLYYYIICKALVAVLDVELLFDIAFITSSLQSSW